MEGVLSPINVSDNLMRMLLNVRRIHAMHNAKFALGTWKRVVKTRPVALILNLFLQVCALFQVKIILKSI